MSVQMLLVILAAVVVIVFSNVLARKVGVAGPLILVAVGVGVSFIPAVPALSVDPQMILVGVLPPLLYSAAVSAPRIEFRRDATAIGGLAVLLVIISAVVLGLFFSWVIPGLGLGLGIALGAILSPTDAVATAIIKKQGAPRRVLAVLEGESLLNDATALVTLRTAIAAVAVSFSALGTLGSFVWAVVSAVVVGGIVGAVALRVRAWTNSAVANTALGLTVPYLAYLPTETLGGSGIVAAVAAGIVCGQGAIRFLTPAQRVSDRFNWSTIEFVLEGAVFLMMGLELYGIVSDGRATSGTLTGAVWIAAVAFVILVLVRAAYVFPMLGLHNARVRRSVEKRISLNEDVLAGRDQRPSLPVISARRHSRAPRSIRRMRNDMGYFEASPLTWKDSTIVVWAGMRGVVTLAAAQTLPQDTPERDLLVLIAFIVAAGSLMLQGLTIGPLAHALKLDPDDDGGATGDAALIYAELRATAREAVEQRTVVRPDSRPFAPDAYVVPRSWLFDGSSAADAVAEAEELELALVDVMRQQLRVLAHSGRYSTEATQSVLDELDAYEIGLKLHTAED